MMTVKKKFFIKSLTPYNKFTLKLEDKTDNIIGRKWRAREAVIPLLRRQSTAQAVRVLMTSLSPEH